MKSSLRAKRTLKAKAKEIAKQLLAADNVHIVSHIDADGITAGSIAYCALKRAGVDRGIEFVKQLEKETIRRLRDSDHDLIWFTDLGSGQLKELKGLRCIITDHHEPQSELKKFDRGNILSYGNSGLYELNPHRYGIDGAKELSGAGVTYLVAKELGENFDLAPLAIVGAVGDLQARGERKLLGVNRKILDEGIEKGYIKKDIDTSLYGIESRPLPKLLEYANDPILPGLTGDYSACVNFLVEHDIPLKENDEWRTWCDLNKSEKRRILSEIADKLLSTGFPPSYTHSLIGEVYTFPNEKPKTMLHEAKEFSTLLNSCGRYEKGDIGLNICLGKREKSLDKAYELLRGHRKVLVDSLKVVESEGIHEEGVLQYFHGKDRIPETVLGTVAGMVIGSGEVDTDVPIFAFAFSEDEGKVKVSSRGTKFQVESGLDLSQVMSECSEKLGGEGGGHDIAAGAFIPKGEEEKFLKMAKNMVRKQMR